MTISANDMHFLHSSYREKLVEHLFFGELLRYLWCKQDVSVSVLKPEVDNTGYDLVLSREMIVRHVQLKCSRKGAKAASQNINSNLELQPSGCVIWIVVDDRLGLDRYGWFGGSAGTPLPSLNSFTIAKHTKANSQGVKNLRPGIRKIPKKAFVDLKDISEVIEKLFRTTT